MSIGTSPHTRIFGLDLLRAVAILLVVYSHADDLLYRFFSVDTGVSDVDGVDLFFVLSGYLIGGILLRTALQSSIPWHLRLADFWQRRWLRTLPNYYLFLLINIAMVHFALAPGLININTLAYFVFLQNFMVPLDLLFFESWSLAIEEWFYLFFPLLLLVVLVLCRNVKFAFFTAALIMIVFSTVMRFPAYHAVDSMFKWDLLVRKIVLLRLDTIGFGALAAWVHYYFSRSWERYKFPLFIVGLVGFSIAVWLRGDDRLWYMSACYYSFAGLSMALWLPALSLWISEGKWGGPITFLSKISYAMYLVNLPLRSLITSLLEDSSLARTIMIYTLYWVLCIAFASVVYRFWERPFMELRKRLSKRLLTPSTEVTVSS